MNEKTKNKLIYLLNELNDKYGDYEEARIVLLRLSLFLNNN